MVCARRAPIAEIKVTGTYEDERANTFWLTPSRSRRLWISRDESLSTIVQASLIELAHRLLVD